MFKALDAVGLRKAVEGWEDERAARRLCSLQQNSITEVLLNAFCSPET